MNEKATPVRIHIIVSGGVQGVGFRYFAQNLAWKYNLTGYVRNHHDFVEIEAQGKSSTIELFVEDLKYKAPHAAVVQSVDVRYIDTPLDEGNDFRILSTIHKD